MQIEKTYFTLGEVLARWRIPEADLVYLAENGRLSVSIRVFSLRLEFGDHEETADGERFAVPHEVTAFSGLLDLHPHDVFYLFRDGEAQVTQFLSARADYAQVVEESAAVRVRPCSFLVRREERDRFEAEVGFRVEGSAPAMPAFLASEDYREVRHAGVDFHLGSIQAQVVGALHAAAQAGDPWRCGKVLLAEAGARSLKMSDLFKSKPNWRQLILSNGRGFYRLAGD